jgi:hypothetical protein
MSLTLSILYAIAAIFALCVAHDFYRSKDGILRIILIQLFLTFGLRYLAFFVANALECSLFVRLTISSIAIPLELLALVRLWHYVRWKE